MRLVIGILTMFFIYSCGGGKYVPPDSNFLENDSTDESSSDSSSSSGSSSDVEDTTTLLEWYDTVAYYADNFEGKLASFWSKELEKESRAQIVEDPLDSKNNVLRLQCLPGDKVANGHRAEVKVKGYENSEGRLARYSFRFMMPEDFFQVSDKPHAIIIHQWHDQPGPGESWSNHPARHAPVNMYVSTSTNPQKYQLKITMGLWGELNNGNEVKENKNFTWSNYLKPEQWYSFECEIKWSQKDKDAYIIAKVDDIGMIDDKNADKKFEKRNIFDSHGNYLKMGIYANGIKNRTITMYYDDFDYTIYEKKD